MILGRVGSHHLGYFLVVVGEGLFELVFRVELVIL